MKKQMLMFAIMMIFINSCWGKTVEILNELPVPKIENNELRNNTVTVYTYEFPNGKTITIMQSNNGVIQLFAGDWMTTLNEDATLEELLPFVLETYNSSPEDDFTRKLIYNHPWK